MGRGTAEQRVVELISDGRRWTEGDAREVLSVWTSSGESGPAFGRRFGIVPQRLWWWRSRLSTRASSFVPVEVTRTEAVVVVTTEEGVRVEVPAMDAASVEWVAMLIERLRKGAT
jgi:hypothetical protein